MSAQSSQPLGAFLAGLSAALDTATDQELAWAWSSSHRRTHYYRTVLMPRIAERMGLSCACEILQVDYAFFDGQSVPLVFVESENDSFSAAQEVGKLASLRAPVRALFSVVPWSLDPEVWPPGVGMRDQLLPLWTSIADTYAHAYGDAGGAFIAVVGEWRPDQNLVFYAHALGPASQDLLPPDGLPLWHRTMTVTQGSAADSYQPQG